MMLCCVCLVENPPNLNVFDNALNVAEIVNKHLWLKPIFTDALTLKICVECWDKIYDFHKFYVRVEKVHREFNGEDKPSVNNIKQEKENFGNYLIKIEVDETKISENNEVATNSKNPLHDSGESEKDYEFQNEADSEEYEPSATNDPSYEYEAEDRKKMGSKKIKNTTKTDTSKKKRFYHLDQIRTREIIKKHIQMSCNLCIYVGKSFPDIVKHFKDHHENIKPYIMCCEKKFTKGHIIAQHAYVHENPKSFSCTECNKSYTTSYGLRLHNKSYHSLEEKRTYACENCSRKFGRRGALELHIQTHTPKEQWAFVCPKCTTRTAKFGTEFLLNIHIRNYHKEKLNGCQECGKEIRDKKSFEKHVRSHFEAPKSESTKSFSCTECHKSYATSYGLRRHKISYHIPKDQWTFVCTKCTLRTSKFATQYSLKRHYRQYHKQKKEWSNLKTH